MSQPATRKVEAPPLQPVALVRRAALGRVAGVGVLLFAFSAGFSIALAYLGILVFTLAFVAQGQQLRPLLAQPVIWASLGFAAFIVAHSIAWYLLAPSPAYASTVAEAAADWVKLLLFIPLAWWLAKNPTHIGHALALAALGLAFGFLRSVEWGALDATFFTRQFDAYLSPLALGLYAGTAALGVIVCRAALISWMGMRLRPWTAPVIWVALLVFFLEILVLSFSRSAWLGFAACMVIWSMLAVKRGLRPAGSVSHRDALLSAAAVMLLLVATIGVNFDSLSQRLTAEQDFLSQLASGELVERNPGSITIRLHGWIFGYELWSQRPWLGWGAGSSDYWIQASGLPQLSQHGIWLSDLHNSYLEVLFQFGAVGAALLGLLVALLVRDAVSAGRRLVGNRTVSPCVCDLLLLSALFAGLWMLTNDRTTNYDFRFFWMLIAGSAYALHLASVLTPLNPQAQPELGRPH